MVSVTEPLTSILARESLVTHNVRNEVGIMNGATGVFLTCLSRSSVLVHFDNGAIHPDWNITEPCGDVSKSDVPVRYLYASTLSKIQGFSLDALAVLPDTNVKAAAYAAVSRVRAMTDLWWVTEPSRGFFAPRYLWQCQIHVSCCVTWSCSVCVWVHICVHSDVTDDLCLYVC